ncbi:MAG: molybdopterin oxidoreductase [Solirubrobacteraceae bacterium]
MSSSPRFLQGIFDFDGRGMHAPFLLDAKLTYSVPVGNEAQLVYFRGGNVSSELACAIVMRDGEPMRYFPIGARSSTHVALRVVEDLLAETSIELHLAAPEGASGQIVVDLGLIEI